MINKLKTETRLHVKKEQQSYGNNILRIIDAIICFRFIMSKTW